MTNTKYDPSLNLSAPFYSLFLAEHKLFRYKAVWEQYGLYLTTAAGAVALGRSCFRVYHLHQYVKLIRQPGLAEEAQWALDLANVEAWQLRNTNLTAARLLRQGATKAVGWPFLWFAWRYSVHHGHDYIE